MWTRIINTILYFKVVLWRFYHLLGLPEDWNQSPRVSCSVQCAAGAPDCDLAANVDSFLKITEKHQR